MIEATPVQPDPAAEEALLGLLSVVARIDALLRADAQAPPCPDPTPPDDPVLEAALGIIALRRSVVRGLARAADGAVVPPPEPPPPPLRDLLR